jgi:hypothetical protein
MSDDRLLRHGAGHHEGPARAAPYPMSRLAPPHDLVDVARQIQEASQLVAAGAENKLKLIADQIRHLQDEARAILERARRDAELHQAKCQFQKRPGETYHLYRRPEGTLYFSMLSPDDWRGSPPHAFEGSYRLEIDMSWTAAGEIARRDDDYARVRGLLGTAG